MSFLSKPKNQVFLSNRELAEKRYKESRSALLLIVITSVINLFMVAFAGSYFLFAPSMPTMFIELMLMAAGEEGVEVSALLIPFILGLVLTLPYLLCWIFSKKRVGWMIAALVIFAVDCVYLVGMYELASIVKDLIFHALILFYVIVGIVNGVKLKKMPAEVAAEVAASGEAAPDEAVFETFNQDDFRYEENTSAEAAENTSDKE